MAQIIPIDNRRKNFWLTILCVGFFVGFLDASAAVINYVLNTHKNPIVISKYIASAVFGKKAYSGEPSMIFFGFLFHFLIAYSFTLLFFFLYPKINFLSKNRLLTGIIYGIFIWLVMNLFVLPLTNVAKQSFTLKPTITGILILIVAIGLPLSYIAYNYYNHRNLERKVITR